MAVEQDVREGRAVFYIQGTDEIGSDHVDIGLPHCAILSTDGDSFPVVIIQSERHGDKHAIGYRPLRGDNGICTIAEVELLEEPDQRFTDTPNKFGRESRGTPQ
jgi:hypothetical protein